MRAPVPGIGRIFLMGLISLVFPAVVLQKQEIRFDAYDDALPPNEAAVDTQTNAPNPTTTLVHFDPYFMGGFRNQHMRFVAFVAFAVDHNISQILLPSLRWVDPYNKPHSIHHELLFDVQYWNERAGKFGLPKLVDYDPGMLEGAVPIDGQEIGSVAVTACWNETSSLYSGLDEGHLRNPRTNLRRTKTWEMIGQGEQYSHCRRTMGKDGENNPERIKEAARDANNTDKVIRFTHLVPHGGVISSGRLWWEYNILQDRRRQTSETLVVDGQVVQVHPEHVPVERAVYELLRPSRRLRAAVDDAIRLALQNTTIEGRQPRLLALHPRVEQEMLTHRCAKFMEPRLAKVFELIQTHPSFREGNSTEYRFDLVFVAVSKAEVEKPAQTRDADINQIVDENRETLRRAREHGLFGSEEKRSIPIFESGTDSAAKMRFPRRKSGNSRAEETLFDTAESLGVIELVASVINFFTAVDADVFVGVKGSTYSTDAFSQRYYQHIEDGGGENYIIGREGLQRLYGPAAPHACA